MQKKRTVNYSLLSFLKHRINGGMLLMSVALIAMLIANSPLGEAYQSFWSHPMQLSIGDFNLFSQNGKPLTLMEFINDALMALFFFSVGLEIKREIMVGELSSFRKAMLPIIAAFGGMLFPVLIYFLVAPSGPEASGLAIPMATDIAFSLGVLSLFGRRVPISLKIFLTAFAIVDDIGGILVIAIFYSNDLAMSYLIASVVVLAILYMGNRMGVMHKMFYIVFGIVMWYFFLQSGINCTIAGVLIAFMIPAKPRLDVKRYIKRMRDSLDKFPDLSTNGEEIIVLDDDQINELKSIEAASSRVISPLQSIENSMHGWINYFVMPLFAFANAGVVLSGGGGDTFGMVTLAVLLGLTLGKFVGVFSFTFLAIKLNLVQMPKGMDWHSIAGVSLLGGIGFTVSLFIANLSFGTHPDLLNQAKLGVLLGTIVSGLLGYVVLNYVLPKESSLEPIEE